MGKQEKKDKKDQKEEDLFEEKDDNYNDVKSDVLTGEFDTSMLDEDD